MSSLGTVLDSLCAAHIEASRANRIKRGHMKPPVASTPEAIRCLELLDTILVLGSMISLNCVGKVPPVLLIEELVPEFGEKHPSQRKWVGRVTAAAFAAVGLIPLKLVARGSGTARRKATLYTFADSID